MAISSSDILHIDSSPIHMREQNLSEMHSNIVNPEYQKSVKQLGPSIKGVPGLPILPPGL
jgi:hypothetical protein